MNQHLESPPVQAGLLPARTGCRRQSRITRRRTVPRVRMLPGPAAMVPNPARLTPPLSRGRAGLAATLPQLSMPRVQLRHHALATAWWTIRSRSSGARTCSREAQHVERVWLAFSPRLPVRHGMWSPLDSARVLCPGAPARTAAGGLVRPPRSALHARGSTPSTRSSATRTADVPCAMRLRRASPRSTTSGQSTCARAVTPPPCVPTVVSDLAPPPLLPPVALSGSGGGREDRPREAGGP